MGSICKRRCWSKALPNLSDCLNTDCDSTLRKTVCMSRSCSQHSSFVFFFQAEDGIRDLTVTGVQTCALPISCIGHCFSYANYEPASGEFRVRVRKGSPVVTSSTDDAEDMASGEYEVDETDRKSVV